LNVAVSLTYLTSINLDVEDGIVNGSTCIVKHIQYNDELDNPTTIWVEFDQTKIGERQRTSNRSLYLPCIHKTWTPIFAVK
jgi:hypothetical protein